MNSSQNNNYKEKLKEMWPDEYFSDRKKNNPKRLKQFEIDKKLIKEFIQEGNICDIGCSTGEFLSFLNWNGKLYGTEINENAKKEASKFISFEKNIFTEENFFDLVIFRGTIQHVDEPFRMIKESFKALKNNGYIVFLSTPNVNSPLYKLKRNLPVLIDRNTIFYLPSDESLSNVLKNFGFSVEKIDFPYYATPYANPLKDHLKFLLNIFSKKFYPHAFWKSSMNIVAKKKI